MERKNITEKIYVRVMNTDLAKKLGAYYKNFFDFSAVYFVVDDENGKINFISKNFGNKLAIEKLHEQAVENMERDGIVVSSLADMFGIPVREGMIPPYVLSAASCGAAALLSKKILNEALERIGISDCYIIPSSNDELIIYPSTADANELHSQLLDMNKQYLGQDKLSDQLYYYNGNLDTVKFDNIVNLCSLEV